MGDKAQVKIINGDEPPIWLYTHWHGSSLRDAVHRAIKRKQRWDDSEYLTRIIFCEMLRMDGPGALTEETGFGIGTGGQHGDVSLVVEVDLAGRTVDGVSFAAVAT